MPTPPVSNNPLVAEHHAAMVGLNELLKRALRSPQLLGMDKTSSRYATAVAALVEEFASASTSLAADYYANARLDAGITAPYRPPVTESPATNEIHASVVTATRIDPKQAQPLVETNAGLLVASAGKGLLIDAIMGDDKAKKWARVTSPGACAFCRMLATRGAVYKSDKSASFIAHPTAGGKGGLCRCTIEAVFHPESYEPTAMTRADQKLYSDATEHVKPGEQLNAFRRALYAKSQGKAPVLAQAKNVAAAPNPADQMAALLGRLDAAMKPPA